MIDRLFKVRRKPGEIYLRWPINIKWLPDSACSFFDWHAVQDRKNVFYQYYHLGQVLIQIGDSTGHYNAAGKWIPR